MSRPLVVGHTRARYPISLDPDLRQYHLHVLGQFGLGKSTLLEHMIRTDARNSQGLCLIDPHGSLYDDLLRWLTETGLIAQRQVLLLEPSSPLWTFAFNPLDFAGYSAVERATAVDATVSACSAVWGDRDLDATPRMARLLHVIFHALVEKNLTLREGLDLCLPTSPLRHQITTGLANQIVQAEWDDLKALPLPRYGELFESTRNSLQRFLLDETVGPIVSQTQGVLDLLRVMDDGAILLVNLARIGEKQKKLLGTLLVSNFVTTALTRRAANKSRPFYLYIDECYDYLNRDITKAITQCRKFGLHLALSHQNLGQLRDDSGPAVYSSIMQIPNRIVFGGLPVEEAAELADSLFAETYDTNKPKAILNKPVVVGYVKEFLSHYSHTTGSSWSSGRGASQGETRSQLYDEDGNELAGYAVASNVGDSDSETEGGSDAESEGWSETWRPILEERPTATVSLEEQRHEASVRVRGLLQRQAIVKLFGKPAVQVLTPLVEPAIARDERVEKAKLAVFERAAFSLPRVEAQRRIAERRQNLLGAATHSKSEPKSFLE